MILANLKFAIEKPLDPETRPALGDAREAAERMVRLLTNLLDLARLEESGLVLRRAACDVRGLVSTLAKQRTEVARSRELSIAVVGDPAPCSLAIDADLLSRVLENILDNAMRHAPPGGQIEARTDRVNGAIEIRVGNTGASVSPASRTLIFQKFHQELPNTGRMNLGLGLYFCRLAVEAHGGTIRVEETERLPTVFVVRLPQPVFDATRS